MATTRPPMCELCGSTNIYSQEFGKYYCQSHTSYSTASHYAKPQPPMTRPMTNLEKLRVIKKDIKVPIPEDKFNGDNYMAAELYKIKQANQQQWNTGPGWTYKSTVFPTVGSTAAAEDDKQAYDEYRKKQALDAYNAGLVTGKKLLEQMHNGNI